MSSENPSSLPRKTGLAKKKLWIKLVCSSERATGKPNEV